jgi:hypothetical protein
MKANIMRVSEKKAINALRSRGFAVTLFYPEELNGKSPIGIENLMVEAANEYLSLWDNSEVELEQRIDTRKEMYFVSRGNRDGNQ